MLKTLKKRLAAFVTVAICALIMWKIFEKTNIMIWIHMPWWGALIVLGVIFIAVDFIVKQVFGTDE